MDWWGGTGRVEDPTLLVCAQPHHLSYDDLRAEKNKGGCVSHRNLDRKVFRDCGWLGDDGRIEAGSWE